MIWSVRRNKARYRIRQRTKVHDYERLIAALEAAESEKSA